MKTREQIIAENPIEPYAIARGLKPTGGGPEKMCKCPWHSDGTKSLGINVRTGLWVCHAGCGGGSIIDLMAKFEGINPKVILKRLGETPEGWKPAYSAPDTLPDRKDAPTGQPDPKAGQPKEKPKLVKTYDYRDASGELIYQACRLEPKSFRQRRPNPDFDGSKPHGRDNSQWLWNMDGIERVLYQLPKVVKHGGLIWICEGEKDCDNISALPGWVATCNVGGAGKWLEAYSEVLRGKSVVLCGDNDKPGKEHMEAVLESLAGKAKSVQVIHIPEPHKDVSDLLATIPNPEDQFNALTRLLDEAPLFDRGVNLPLYTIPELRQQYIQSITRAETHSLDLGRWLPSLGIAVRPLVGGEVVAILGGTGVGKTALAQNIARFASPMKSLFFEQELPGSLTFERFAAIATNTSSRDVFKSYKQGSRELDQTTENTFGHVLTCTRSRLTLDQIEEFIVKSELKFGERPALVVVDYIQLMGGKGERRERVANAAEGLKGIAKNTNTVVVILSQISRKSDDDGPEVRLSDGKEAGEIENSAGVVLGAWRVREDEGLIRLKVLKNTKGLAGRVIDCNFIGDRLTINERIVETEADVKAGYQRPKEKRTYIVHKND